MELGKSCCQVWGHRRCAMAVLTQRPGRTHRWRRRVGSRNPALAAELRGAGGAGRGAEGGEGQEGMNTVFVSTTNVDG
eukprot:3501680-Rhodomonas_salina.2